MQHMGTELNSDAQRHCKVHQGHGVQLEVCGHGPGITVRGVATIRDVVTIRDVASNAPLVACCAKWSLVWGHLGYLASDTHKWGHSGSFALVTRGDDLGSSGRLEAMQQNGGGGLQKHPTTHKKQLEDAVLLISWDGKGAKEKNSIPEGQQAHETLWDDHAALECARSVHLNVVAWGLRAACRFAAAPVHRPTAREAVGRPGVTAGSGFRSSTRGSCMASGTKHDQNQSGSSSMLYDKVALDGMTCWQQKCHEVQHSRHLILQVIFHYMRMRFLLLLLLDSTFGSTMSTMTTMQQQRRFSPCRCFIKGNIGYNCYPPTQ
eukprot:384688-Pelagomonas_calceolata.AAC.6